MVPSVSTGLIGVSGADSLGLARGSASVYTPPNTVAATCAAGSASVMTDLCSEEVVCASGVLWRMVRW